MLHALFRIVHDEFHMKREFFRVSACFFFLMRDIFVIKRAVFMNESPYSMAALASALGNKARWRALQELAAGEPLMTIELSRV